MEELITPMSIPEDAPDRLPTIGGVWASEPPFKVTRIETDGPGRPVRSIDEDGWGYMRIYRTYNIYGVPL